MQIENDRLYISGLEGGGVIREFSLAGVLLRTFVGSNHPIASFSQRGNEILGTSGDGIFRWNYTTTSFIDRPYNLWLSWCAVSGEDY